MKIILSYERTDQGLAERASTALSKALRGAEIFYDDWLVRQSDGALSRSGIRLSEYDCLFLLLSKASISSETDWGEWTKKVLSVARSDMRFIPVLLDECDTPECFLRMHYIDIFRIGEDAGFMQMVDIASSIDSLRDGVAVSDNIEALVRFTGGAGKIEIEVRPKITAELISSLAVILENEAESVVYSNELVTRSGKGIPIENDKGEKRFLYPLFLGRSIANGHPVRILIVDNVSVSVRGIIHAAVDGTCKAIPITAIFPDEFFHFGTDVEIPLEDVSASNIVQMRQARFLFWIIADAAKKDGEIWG